MYAARELRFSVLTVPVKRKAVSLTTTGPFTFYGSFSFAQTEFLPSSLWRSLLWDNTTGYLSIKYIVHTILFCLNYFRFWDMDSRDFPAEILEENIDYAGSLLSSLFPPCSLVAVLF